MSSYHPHSILRKHLSWEVARTPRKRRAGGLVQLPPLGPHTHRAGVCSVCPGFGAFSLTGWGTYTGQAPWYCLLKEAYGKEDGATRMMADERGMHRSWKPSSEGSGVTGSQNACERWWEMPPRGSHQERPWHGSFMLTLRDSRWQHRPPRASPCCVPVS